LTFLPLVRIERLDQTDLGDEHQAVVSVADWVITFDVAADVLLITQRSQVQILLPLTGKRPRSLAPGASLSGSRVNCN
jgi:hypothetical protein